jgi:DNA mismatch repair protein MutL
LKAETKAPRIRVLPRDVVIRIAAGEVIERPASVVKELVENSIDAGASRIEVEVRGAPHVYLSVEDDGCGMTAAEMRLALERHATSKIFAEGDLNDITTLGFRGEALPSIAAVSKVELSSQEKDAPGGLLIKFVDGAIDGEEQMAMSAGTRVEVRDLFYNLPVRKKFLKSPETELRHIIRLLEACALAHRNVFFRLLRDGDTVLSVPSSADLRDRVSSVHGSQLAGGLIPISGSDRGVEVDGLVGKPEASRSSRESMVFVVNGRWIASPMLAKAVRDAYGDLLPPGRFPPAFVLLRVDPALMDANVHPSKREVRFSSKAPVFEVVRGSVTAALSEHAPELWPEGEVGTTRGTTEVPARQESLGLGAGGAGFARREPAGTVSVESAMNLYKGREPGEERQGVVCLWQLHGSYIIGQTGNGLVIIDQHAAHERIQYEAALEHMREGGGGSQQLMFPQVMDLSATEHEILLDILPYMEKLGFDVRQMSRLTISVYGIPASVKEWREGGMLRDMLEEFALGGHTETDLYEGIAKSYACHASVKAGQPLSLEEMNVLVDKLFATAVPHGDPHGRPTYLQISLSELERRFGRS